MVKRGTTEQSRSGEHIFFFSYARDDDDPYLSRFFEELRDAIRRQQGLKASDPIAFRDQTNIEVGQQWPVALTHSLRTSKTLVCVYSPTYFNREYCGKEVQVFLTRQKKHGTGLATGILPVIWQKPERVAAAVSAIQYEGSVAKPVDAI
jgi:hypothetical protein